MLKLAFVTGVTPTKWLRTWNDRRRDRLEAFPVDEADQTSALRDGRADAAIVRLPLSEDAGLSVIRLYSEIAVVVAPKDHAIAAVDSVTLADLADEPRVADAGLEGDVLMEVVAAGAGIVVLPHSLARLHARKDLVSRPVTDAPETEIALVWPTAATTLDIEEFIGIVRGRTANSSRGSAAEEAAAAKKAAEAAKAAAKKKAAQPVKKPRTAASIRVASARGRGKKRRG